MEVYTSNKYKLFFRAHGNYCFSLVVSLAF